MENSDCNDSRGMVGAAVDLTAYQNLWHIEEVSLIRSAITLPRHLAGHLAFLSPTEVGP